MKTSYNSEPVFVTTQPDWAEMVKASYMHSTAIFPSRSGKEQRTRGRFDGRARIEYENRGLTKEQWDNRISEIRVEMRSVCIVPFWTEGLAATLTDRFIGRRCAPDGLRKAAPERLLRRCARGIYELEEWVREDWFSAGEWVYLWDGKFGQFRRVLSSANELRGIRRASWHHLRAASPVAIRLTRPAASILTLYPPSPGAPELAENLMIYPCKACRRIPGNQEGRRLSQHTFNESLVFEAL